MTTKISDPKELLLKVARLFSKPGRWTRNAYARTKRRALCSPTDKGAYCFCALGAIERFANDEIAERVAKGALRHVVGRPIVEWNDSHGPRGAKVVAQAFRDAAAGL